MKYMARGEAVMVIEKWASARERLLRVVATADATRIVNACSMMAFTELETESSDHAMRIARWFNENLGIHSLRINGFTYPRER